MARHRHEAKIERHQSDSALGSAVALFGKIAFERENMREVMMRYWQ